MRAAINPPTGKRFADRRGGSRRSAARIARHADNDRNAGPCVRPRCRRILRQEQAFGFLARTIDKSGLAVRYEIACGPYVPRTARVQGSGLPTVIGLAGQKMEDGSSQKFCRPSLTRLHPGGSHRAESPRLHSIWPRPQEGSAGSSQRSHAGSEWGLSSDLITRAPARKLTIYSL